MTARPKALVLGSDARSFLAVVRSLGRAGFEVHSAWTARDSVARKSRYLSRAHEIRRPEKDSDDDWIADLNTLQSKHAFQITVPCNDQSLLPIRAQSKRIDQYEIYAILNDSALTVANSKIESATIAKSLGVPVPEFVVVDAHSDLTALSQCVTYPAIVKPESSYVNDQLTRKQEVKKATSVDDFAAKVKPMLRTGRALVQKYFDGVGTGVEFLAIGGEIVRSFQHLRLHEPPGGGGSSYRRSIARHPEMLEATKKLAAHLNYTGVGMVEFLWDRDSGEWRFVEINGRFWGSLPLAIASGCDFPADLARSRVGDLATPKSDYRVGVHARNLTSDKNWLSDFLRASDRSLPGKMITITCGGVAALGRWAQGKETIDTFALDDPKPFFAECVTLAGTVISGAGRKMRSRWRRSRFSRTRQRKRLHAAVSSAHSLLFVCKGNICRSPFAEAYANSIASPHLKISSAGYYPAEGRPSPDNAQTAAIKLGIEISGHRSTELTARMVDDHDVILVFDEENLDRLSQFDSDCRDKLFLIESIHKNGPLVISDPYGRSVDDFVDTYQRIKRSINALSSLLPGPTSST